CAWLKLFNYRDSLIEKVISRWKNIIEKSVVFGKIDYEEYKKQYRLEYGRSGVREISISNFYMVCLLKDVLDEDIKSAYFNYVMEKGIYYIYDNNLFELPHNFDSKQTINYLVAIKLISFYANKGDLDFVYEYLMKNRNED